MIPTVIFPAVLEAPHNITVRRSDLRHTLKTAYGITRTLERVVEPVQPLERTGPVGAVLSKTWTGPVGAVLSKTWTGPVGAVLSKTHSPRYPGFIFAFIGFLILSSAWVRMFQTSSTVDFLEWFAIGVGFFMLAYVRRDWVRGGM